MMYNLRKWCLKSFPCIVSHVIVIILLLTFSYFYDFLEQNWNRHMCLLWFNGGGSCRCRLRRCATTSARYQREREPNYVTMSVNNVATTKTEYFVLCFVSIFVFIIFLVCWTGCWTDRPCSNGPGHVAWDWALGLGRLPGPGGVVAWAKASPGAPPSRLGKQFSKPLGSIGVCDLIFLYPKLAPAWLCIVGV